MAGPPPAAGDGRHQALGNRSLASSTAASSTTSSTTNRSLEGIARRTSWRKRLDSSSRGMSRPVIPIVFIPGGFVVQSLLTEARCGRRTSSQRPSSQPRKEGSGRRKRETLIHRKINDDSVKHLLRRISKPSGEVLQWNQMWKGRRRMSNTTVRTSFVALRLSLMNPTENGTTPSTPISPGVSPKR